MQRKFILNLALLLSLNLLIKPFWMLGVDRGVQNAVGPEQYGIYFTLFNLSFLFNIFLDLGITNFNNKNIAQNNQLLSKHFSGLFALKILLSLLYISFTLIMSFILRYDANQSKFLIILAGNQVLTSLILYLRSNISGLHLFKTDSILSVLDRLIMIFICGIWLWSGLISIKMSILYFAYAQTFALFITAVIAFILVFKNARTFRFEFNVKFCLMILKKSFPFAILVLLMTFYNRIDTVMLERLLKDGAEQSGIYAMAYRLLDSANMIAYLFSVILLPMFARMIKDNQEIEKLAMLSFKMLMVLSIIVAFTAFFFAEPMMNLLYHSKLKEASEVFSLIMFCFIATSTAYVFGTLLTANGNLKYLNAMALIGMLLNISLNFILIPKYKVIGAVYASIITQFITAIFQLIIAHKIFAFKPNFSIGFRLLLFVLGVMMIQYLFSSMYSGNWMLGLILGATFSVFLSFFIGLINVKQLLSFIKKPIFA